jgi:HD-GYP domain-containing protein (c-di-GMP phosphodiesterase class II)
MYTAAHIARNDTDPYVAGQARSAARRDSLRKTRSLWTEVREILRVPFGASGAHNPLPMDTESSGEHALEQALRRTRHALIQTVHAVNAVAAHRDRYTALHQRRTAALTLGIGQQLGLDADRLEGLYLGALVHDLGKVAIPSEVLNKPARLTPEEYAFVKTHVQVGCDILQNVVLPWPIHAIVAQHHERLDGSGYPRGLTASAIVLEARIVAVADVFQAMTDHRPYRTAPGRDAALQELDRGAGVTFDAEVIRALRAVLAGQQSVGGDLWTRLESDEAYTSTVILPTRPLDTY